MNIRWWDCPHNVSQFWVYEYEYQVHMCNRLGQMRLFNILERKMSLQLVASVVELNKINGGCNRQSTRWFKAIRHCGFVPEVGHLQRWQLRQTQGRRSPSDHLSWSEGPGSGLAAVKSSCPDLCVPSNPSRVPVVDNEGNSLRATAALALQANSGSMSATTAAPPREQPTAVQSASGFLDHRQPLSPYITQGWIQISLQVSIFKNQLHKKVTGKP